MLNKIIFKTSVIGIAIGSCQAEKPNTTLDAGNQQNQSQAAPGSIFMPPPSSKLGARHKNKNPTGNPIGLILVWELLDSNQ